MIVRSCKNFLFDVHRVGRRSYYELMISREINREKQRAQSGKEELLERMAFALPNDGAIETLDGLFLARLTEPMETKLTLYEPALCFVVQGHKQVLVGEEVLQYDPGNYLLFTVDLPVVFRVEEASKELPYFGLRLNLDPAIVTSVMPQHFSRGLCNTKRTGDPFFNIDVSSLMNLYQCINLKLLLGKLSQSQQGAIV